MSHSNLVFEEVDLSIKELEQLYSWVKSLNPVPFGVRVTRETDIVNNQSELVVYVETGDDEGIWKIITFSDQ